MTLRLPQNFKVASKFEVTSNGFDAASNVFDATSNFEVASNGFKTASITNKGAPKAK